MIQPVSNSMSSVIISKCDAFNYTVDIRVRFTRARFTGSEVAGFVLVTSELVGGTSVNPFNVTVTPSEQSPVSAEGNSVMCMIMC